MPELDITGERERPRKPGPENVEYQEDTANASQTREVEDPSPHCVKSRVSRVLVLSRHLRRLRSLPSSHTRTSYRFRLAILSPDAGPSPAPVRHHLLAAAFRPRPTKRAAHPAHLTRTSFARNGSEPRTSHLSHTFVCFSRAQRATCSSPDRHPQPPRRQAQRRRERDEAPPPTIRRRSSQGGRANTGHRQAHHPRCITTRSRRGHRSQRPSQSQSLAIILSNAVSHILFLRRTLPYPRMANSRRRRPLSATVPLPSSRQYSHNAFQPDPRASRAPPNQRKRAPALPPKASSIVCRPVSLNVPRASSYPMSLPLSSLSPSRH